MGFCWACIDPVNGNILTTTIRAKKAASMHALEAAEGKPWSELENEFWVVVRVRVELVTPQHVNASREFAGLQAKIRNGRRKLRELQEELSDVDA